MTEFTSLASHRENTHYGQRAYKLLTEIDLVKKLDQTPDPNPLVGFCRTILRVGISPERTDFAQLLESLPEAHVGNILTSPRVH
jgi:hypothetical protein